MTLWKVHEGLVAEVPQTQLKQEKILEQHLEDWIASNPGILGERLLIIGRQVIVPDTKDRLDLLALDAKGNAVVIELKRGKLKDPVDMQALRYASYLSRWDFEEFEVVARGFLDAGKSTNFNFNSLFEDFCEEAGTDEIPDINNDQRLIIVGTSVKERLGSVALWLRDHNVDVKLIEIRAFKDGDGIFIEPHLIVPVPVSRFGKVGTGPVTGQPWLTDGKEWHLEKRCNPSMKKVLVELDNLLRDRFDLDGPHWQQKFYVAYKVGGFNWLWIRTQANQLLLDFRVTPGVFETGSLADRLGTAVFDKQESLAGKLGLPSSVFVRNMNSNMDRIRLRVKDDLDYESEEFLSFLDEARDACPSGD